MKVRTFKQELHDLIRSYLLARNGKPVTFAALKEVVPVPSRALVDAPSTEEELALVYIDCLCSLPLNLASLIQE